MCARPLSPRHAQPDWMGGGLASRQMMHAPPSAAIFLSNRLAALAVTGEQTSVQVVSKRVLPMAGAKNGLAARRLATGCVDSRFAGLSAARGCCWSGRFIALACATLIVAAGVSFSGIEPATQELSSPMPSPWGTVSPAAAAAAAADALDRVAGMIKKAVYRSSGRRVRGEDDNTPAIRTVAPDLPLDLHRNMDLRVDPWSAPTCAPPNAALRIRPAHARTSGAHVSRSEVPSYKGLDPSPRYRVATRARICSTDFYTYRFEDAQRSPSTRTSGTSRRRTESASWFEMQALTGTYPSTP